MERHCPRTTLTPAWRNDLAQMWDHYLHVGVRQQLRHLFRNSIELLQMNSRGDNADNDIRANRNGEMVTEYPEQVVFIVDSQIRAAREHLPSNSSGSTKYTKYTNAVQVECQKQISTYLVPELRQWMETPGQLSTARFCAMINDVSRLSEILEVRVAEHAVALTEDYDNEHDSSLTSDVIEWGHRATRDLAELSLHGTRILCERIVMDDLCKTSVAQQDVLSSVGRSAWVHDDQGTAVLRTIATFHDYFGDLQVWLPAGYYFPKILRHCFDLSLQNYVHFFYSNTLSGIQDPVIVSENLSRDFLNLTQFFNDMAMNIYAGKAGALSHREINSRLQIIQCMSRLVNPKVSPFDLEEDVEHVLRYTQPSPKGNGRNAEDNEDRCQLQRADAVLHLAGIRQHRQDDKKRSEEWLQVIAQAHSRLSQSSQKGSEDTFLTIQVPDLRHSRSLFVRPQDLVLALSPTARAVNGILQQTAVAPQQKIRGFLANKKVALNL